MAGRSAKHGLGIALAIAAPLTGLAVGALLGLHPNDPLEHAFEKQRRPRLEARLEMGAPEPPDEAAAPTLARAEAPPDGSVAAPEAANVGAIGSLRALNGSWNGPTSPYGASSAAGQDPMGALGALMGDQVGSSFGYGGLGLRGTGRGGGGVGMGTLGTIGHGGSNGARYGLDGTSRVGVAPPGAALDPPHAEDYSPIAENDFIPAASDAVSTFSVDVDTASYANVRRFLQQGSLPPADAVRIEEMINTFDYDYPPPTGGSQPFAVSAEVGACPWAREHRLVQIGVQGRALDQRDVPPRNLVFLVDVSGSMESPDKLPLLVSGLGLLADNLRASDRVAIVVYAGAAGMVLPSTRGDDRGAIRGALADLSAGGSTNGGEGIELAYDVARAHFVRGGINRVILATDGDFNVGATGDAALNELIERERRTGVYLTVLGFGTGNLQDHRMEQLADRGNGNYAYVDSLAEANRVLVEEAGATLWTIAQDVKIQVRFDPARVGRYRLIGYENRLLRDRDFEDDSVDAGEVGAGHRVTALYEIEPVDGAGSLGTVGVRYQPPGGGRSALLEAPVVDGGALGSERLRFAAAVAGFGMVLRRSPHRGDATTTSMERLAEGALGPDPRGHRGELVTLIRSARRLGLR